MAAAFTAQNIAGKLTEGVFPSGGNARHSALLGTAGSGAGLTGKGSWVRCDGIHWKTFQLHGVDHTSSLSTASVEIHGTNDLDAVDADANTKFKIIGTLNNASQFLEFEPPYAWVRAEVKVAQAGVALRVDMYALGI